MHDPNDQRFCPYCGFRLDAYGGCRECDPDSEIEEDPFLRVRAKHRQSAQHDFELDPAHETVPERDLGGCMPVTPPLGLVAGTMGKQPK